jgi:hypothetical protein
MSTGGSIRAGGAFVEIFANDSKLAEGLRGASNKLKAWSGQLASIGASFSLVGGGMVASLIATAKRAAESGDELVKMSRRTGESASALSALAYAAYKSDLGMETVEKSIRIMQKTIAGVDDVAEGTAKGLETIGLSAASIIHLSPTQQLMAIREKLLEIQNPAQRAAAAMKVFGKSGVEIIPMLEDLPDLLEEAKKLGYIKTDASIEAASALDDAMKDAAKATSAAAGALGAEMVPLVKEYSETVTYVAREAAAWIKAHRDLVEIGVKAAVAVTGIGAAAFTASKALSILSGALMVFSGHPAVLALFGLTAAVAMFGNQFTHTAKITSDAVNALESQYKQNATDQALFNRLEKLSQQTALTDAQMTEAEGIVAALTARYGDLGITIDRTTGSINGLDDAHDKATEGMRKATIDKLKDSIREQQENLNEIQWNMKTAAAGDVLSAQGLLSAITFGLVDRPDSLPRLDEKAAHIQATLKRLREELQKIKSGDLETLTGGKERQRQPDGASPEDAREAERRAERKAEFEQNAAEKLHHLKLQQIKDEYLREIALINEKYDAELAKAQELGANMDSIQEARRVEIEAAERKQKQREDEERKKKEEEERRAEEDRADFVASMEDQTQREEINAKMKGVEREKALLKMEEEKALAEARAKGVDEAFVKEQFARRAALLDMAAPEKDDFQSKLSASGTFSAWAAPGMGGGRQLDRIALATEETAKNTKDIKAGGLG